MSRLERRAARGRNWVRNTLGVARRGRRTLYALTTLYPESDALNPAGQLLRHVLGTEETRSVLATGSPLSALWASPSGELWMGGADGSAWTTAEVTWPGDGPSFERQSDSPLRWKVTRLPLHEGSGLAPNVTGVWGHSDSDVFFATHAGTVFHWDGRLWRESPVGSGSSLVHIGVDTFAGGDAWAVGYGGTIARRSMEGWVTVTAPAIDAQVTIVTGIAVPRSGQAVAATNRGEVLRPSREPSSFEVVARVPGVRFSGVARWGDDGVMLASDQGAWRYDRRGLRPVKENFSATDVLAIGNRLYFIETDQPLGPSCIEFFPWRQGGGSRWQRLVF